MTHPIVDVVWNVIGTPSDLHLSQDKENETKNTTEQVVYYVVDKGQPLQTAPLVRKNNQDLFTTGRAVVDVQTFNVQSEFEGLSEHAESDFTPRILDIPDTNRHVPNRQTSEVKDFNVQSDFEVQGGHTESDQSSRISAIPDINRRTSERQTSEVEDLNVQSDFEVPIEHIKYSQSYSASVPQDTDEPTIAGLISEIQELSITSEVSAESQADLQEETIQVFEQEDTMASVRDLDFTLQGLSLHPGGPSTTAAARSRTGGAAANPIGSAVPAEVQKSCDYPFLQHRPTVEYVKRSRVMFIMRGLPGSGKSTVVQLLRETYPNSTSCSADDFFLQPDGSYRFNKDRLSDAHETCQRKAKAACERGCPVVIIDNTNVKMWEMRNYTNLASEHNYTVVAVEPKTPWRNNPQELARRNKHGVPIDVLRKKLQSYDEGVPLYYGWFLNPGQSERVMRLAEKCFKSCRKGFPAYQQLITSMANPGEKLTMQSIYGRTQSSTDNLHCTAFFSNRGHVSTASAYHSQPHVRAALGHTSTIEVIGFVFSPRTAGVRLRLDAENLSLWGKDDNEGPRGAVGHSARLSRRLTDSPRSASSGNRWAMLEEEDKPSRFRPVVGEGSRAHLTLGYTKTSKAVETGLDLIQVVEHEQRVKGENEDRAPGVVKLDGATLRCFGDQFWVVYLDTPCQVQTLFSGRY